METGEDLPGDWADETREKACGTEIRRFVLDSDQSATFLVWVTHRDRGSEPFEIQLTTISDAESGIRRDYTVDTYGTKEEAIAAGAALVDVLEMSIQIETVSIHDPDIEELQDAIDEFLGVGFSSRLRRFLGQLGQ